MHHVTGILTLVEMFQELITSVSSHRKIRIIG
jgi:hypothetical protein